MKSQTDELEQDPAVMYAAVEEKRYKPEIELLDRYLKFAEELLRLALFGVAIFGFLYQYDVLGFKSASVWARILAGVGVIAFALSAICALGYRYFASDALRHYTRDLQLFAKSQFKVQSNEENAGQPSPVVEVEYRDNKLWWTFRFKVSSAIFLGIGTILVALAFAFLLYT